jgi:hypothetical protein
MDGYPQKQRKKDRKKEMDQKTLMKQWKSILMVERPRTLMMNLQLKILMTEAMPMKITFLENILSEMMRKQKTMSFNVDLTILVLPMIFTIKPPDSG